MKSLKKCAELYNSSSFYHHAVISAKVLKGATALFGITQEKEPMNLSLLQRPKRVKKNTKTLYIYYPTIATTSNTLVPGEVLKVLDVFKGDSTSETTLKVITHKDWEDHQWGRGLPFCTRNARSTDPEAELCDCEKELSEMSDEFKAVVHYVLLSDIGK